MQYNDILQVTGDRLVLPINETAKMLNGADFPPSFLMAGSWGMGCCVAW